MSIKNQIVLVSTGLFQNYIKENINQLLKFQFDIHVIVDFPFLKELDEYKSNVELIDSATLQTNFDKKSKLDKKFRNGFWNNTSKRLFLLYEYIKIKKLKNVIHIENDVLLYSNMDYNFEEKIYITMDSNDRCIPGIIYIPKYDLFTNLIENYDFTKNDMINLSDFYLNNKDIVKTFPIIDNTIDECIYNENFQEFNSIFDAAAIGQYLGGVDPRNKEGDTRGFVNETCEIKYDKYIFKWIKNGNNHFPHIEINNKLIPINNLHIHCKKLENYRIENPIENKYIKFEQTDLNTPKYPNHIDIFTNIYETNEWGNNNDKNYKGSSGDGSKINLSYNNFVISFIEKNNIHTVIDLGCGDWQSSSDIYNKLNVEYYGYDAYKDVIVSHRQNYPQYNFYHLDILNSYQEIKCGDLCILKDILQHWTCKEIEYFLDKIQDKFKYILICNCKNQTYDYQDEPLRSRPLNVKYYPLKKYNPEIKLEYSTKQLSIINNVSLQKGDTNCL